VSKKALGEMKKVKEDKLKRESDKKYSRRRILKVS